MKNSFEIEQRKLPKGLIPHASLQCKILEGLSLQKPLIALLLHASAKYFPQSQMPSPVLDCSNTSTAQDL